jgi:nicotinamidase-related amidase
MSITLKTRYYQQFDADARLEVPAESYGGWQTGEVPFDPNHSALVVMHAWDPGSPETDPDWWHTVEYLPRAKRILEEVFPPLLHSVRSSPMKVFHLVGGDKDYYSHLPGYKKHPAGSPTPRIDYRSPTVQQLKEWRTKEVFVGAHNLQGVASSLERLDFAPQARPVGNEGIAADGDQLLALCREHQIDHLVYIGFAINWCLLMSPGGMVDMSRRGLLCSTIADAVTAVENKETARHELEKQQALWRVSLEFGFVFSAEEFMRVEG